MMHTVGFEEKNIMKLSKKVNQAISAEERTCKKKKLGMFKPQVKYFAIEKKNKQVLHCCFIIFHSEKIVEEKVKK